MFTPCSKISSECGKINASFIYKCDCRVFLTLPCFAYTLRKSSGWWRGSFSCVLWSTLTLALTPWIYTHCTDGVNRFYLSHASIKDSYETWFTLCVNIESRFKLINDKINHPQPLFCINMHFPNLQQYTCKKASTTTGETHRAILVQWYNTAHLPLPVVDCATCTYTNKHGLRALIRTIT